MRLLIFILALTSAFFVNADTVNPLGSIYDLNDLRGPESKPWYEYECEIDNTTSRTIKSLIEGLGVCQEIWQPKVDEYIASMKSNTDIYHSVGNYTWVSSREVQIEYTPCSPAPCSIYESAGNPSKTSMVFYGRLLGIEWQHTCPNPNTPEHKYPIYKDPQPTDPAAAPMDCAKLLDGEPEPEPDPDRDPDCPAPTDNDPWQFGTGQQQTVCFDNPDGSQCSIETDSNGGYSMPVSYGSQEPVACTEVDPTDPDPTDPDPTDPDPTDPDPTDPDPTDPDPTDPDPTDPDPTDDTDQTEIIDALNQSNDNLDSINNNMVEGMDESNGLLSDILGEIESFVLGQGEGNDLLEEIANNTAEISDALNGDGEEAPECIGDICDFDSDKHYENADKEMEEWLNNRDDLQLGQEASNLMGKFTSSVSAAFAGFTGSCIPFNLEVSIRGNPHTISVGEHCSYYEDYFKPVLEWFLWVLTFIALIVVSSQSFRAFSTI